MTSLLSRIFRREPRAGDPCPLGGELLPVQDHRRIIWGGTVEEPWGSSLSRGCPRCGETVIELETMFDMPKVDAPPMPSSRLNQRKQYRVRLAPHTIPERVFGRVRTSGWDR